MGAMERVECYAGYKADETPRRWIADGREYTVERVLDRWSEPGADGFRVRTPHGLFKLRHKLIEDTWTAEACPPRS